MSCHTCSNRKAEDNVFPARRAKCLRSPPTVVPSGVLSAWPTPKGRIRNGPLRLPLLGSPASLGSDSSWTRHRGSDSLDTGRFPGQAHRQPDAAQAEGLCPREEGARSTPFCVCRSREAAAQPSPGGNRGGNSRAVCAAAVSDPARADRNATGATSIRDGLAALLELVDRVRLDRIRFTTSNRTPDPG